MMRSLDHAHVLLRLAAVSPALGIARVVEAACAGPLCTQPPDRLTLWAPAGALVRAFQLLAMFKSMAPEACLVLTDQQPDLSCLPHDGRIAVLTGQQRGPAQSGAAQFACADLRNDRIFRLLLEGRVRRRPGLETLLHVHLLAGTAHGGTMLDRWSELLPVLFRGGLQAMMPVELRADLEDLRDAAKAAEHAIMGGFHALDGLVRRPPEWEIGARTYLQLAAARSPSAMVAVARWLDAGAGWERASSQQQEERRVTAATVLHRLVDDPWLDAVQIEPLLAGEAEP